MATFRIPCLVGKRNKAGVTSWYWQPSATLAKAGWQAIALGKDEQTAINAARQRNALVADWKLGGINPGEIRQRARAGTLNALIARYRREVLEGKHPSTGRPLLKPGTKGIYETGLKRLETWGGKHPLAYNTPARVRALRDTVAKPPAQGGLGHSAAFNLLKTGRQVFAFAENIDMIAKGSNPFGKFQFGAPAARRQIWEADDEAAFKAAAIDLGYPSLALALELAIYTAQREGDLIAFTEAQLQSIEIHEATVRNRFAEAGKPVMGWVNVQEKTSDDQVDVQLEIPIEPALLAKVERAIATNRARDRAANPRRLLTHVLVDDVTGKPWKRRWFINRWSMILAHAADKTGREHMRGLVWHDLRRTRVVRLRRRGMHPAMIAAITGHSPQSINMMLRVYGPVDPTMTAAALADSLEPVPVTEEPKEQSA